MSFLPPKLEVQNATCEVEGSSSHPGVRWFAATIPLSIREHGRDNVKSLQAIVSVDGTPLCCSLLRGGNEEIQQGYRLEWSNPIGPEGFVFKFMARTGQHILPRGYIELKIGRHTIRKSFLIVMKVGDATS